MMIAKWLLMLLAAEADRILNLFSSWILDLRY